jgi:hypothetical protein
MKDQKPEYEYVGREQPCGCCVALCVDLGDDHTAETVAEWIRTGLAVTRVERSELEEIFQEPTFMNCPHQNRQQRLL